MSLVALDIDSTIFDLHAALALLPDLGHIRHEDDLYYGWLGGAAGGQDRLEELLETVFQPEHMRRVGLMPGAGEALEYLRDLGVEFHVMTHRSPRYAQVTEDWLTEHGIVYKTFYADNPFDKVARCRELGIELIIDDHPEIIEQALTQGLTPATILYPYNRVLAQDPAVLSAGDWNQLKGLVASRLGLA